MPMPSFAPKVFIVRDVRDRMVLSLFAIRSIALG